MMQNGTVYKQQVEVDDFDETVKTSDGDPLMHKQPMERHGHNQSQSDLGEQEREGSSPIGRVHLLSDRRRHTRNTVRNRP